MRGEKNRREGSQSGVNLNSLAGCPETGLHAGSDAAEDLFIQLILTAVAIHMLTSIHVTETKVTIA